MGSATPGGFNELNNLRFPVVITGIVPVVGPVGGTCAAGRALAIANSN